MGEKLTSAPVFYTLVQFKFNQIAQMGEYVSGIQDTLRKTGYPDFKEENMMAINIRKPDSPEPQIQQTKHTRWSFSDNDGLEGFLLFQDSLVFHTTNYQTFEDFAGKAIKGLSLIHKIIDLAYIDRIGIRYLDSIVPTDDKTLEDCLSPALIGLSSSINGDAKLNHSFTETSMQVDNGTLISRAIVTGSGLAIPPDLVPLSLNLPERVTAITGKNAVLDTDYFIAQRTQDIDPEKLMQQLDSAHKIASNAFKASVTTEALEAWK